MKIFKVEDGGIGLGDIYLCEWVYDELNSPSEFDAVLLIIGLRGNGEYPQRGKMNTLSANRNQHFGSWVNALPLPKPSKDCIKLLVTTRNKAGPIKILEVY